MDPTSAAELRANARAVRARLFAPPNAVVDRGINLRAPKQPPAPLISSLKPIVWMPHKVRISDVFQLVADYYRIPAEMLTMQMRAVKLSRMRRVCLWLAHEVLGRGYPEIVHAMNRRNSQGMMHTVAKMYEDMRTNSDLAYDVAELELRMAALAKLLIAGRPAPEPRIMQAKKKTIGIARVIRITATFYKLPADCLMGNSRVARIAKARQIACYLAHAVLGRTVCEIGRAIQRDHSTVSWATEKVELMLPTDAELSNDIELLKLQILDDRVAP